jgi:hypothetical protein
LGQKISHNAPAGSNVFVARIKALRGKDHGCKKYGEVFGAGMEHGGIT